MFEYIKEYYEEGLYTKDDLKTLLNGELLTQDEYNSLINPAPKS
ncbi:XkdX family protein [Pediococcus acidilactici]|nr:XkdX family protein [Pediococcus acidilactici]MBM6644315.1 XkdX family protein [Pediococcus acidilactici]